MPYRVTSRTVRRGFYLLLLAGAVAAFGSVGLVLAARVDAQRAACRQVNQLRIVITAIIVRSERTLPTLSYYRQHHNELVVQERETGEELARFHPVRC